MPRTEDQVQLPEVPRGKCHGRRLHRLCSSINADVKQAGQGATGTRCQTCIITEILLAENADQEFFQALNNSSDLVC